MTNASPTKYQRVYTCSTCGKPYVIKRQAWGRGWSDKATHIGSGHDHNPNA